MHAAKAERIARQLAAHDPRRPISLHKKAVSHQVPKAHDLRRRDEKIDISDLDEILEIDPVRRICVAEPGVTFVDLVARTMQHGLVPLVVPELKTITIGGAVSGCSIESSSFVHGGFHDTCFEYEVITATGQVLTCTPDNEYRQIFHMMHGSFGTLGVLSKLAFRLTPARPYVHVVYEHHRTLGELQAAIAGHAEARDVDFMDGIIHSPSHHVLCVGRFVDRAPYTNRYDWMKVYYRSTATRAEDYLTTAAYLFRYDRGVTNVRPRSFVGRLLFGKLMSSTRWLWLGNKLPWLLRPRRPTVTLDVFVPFARAAEFMRWYEREIGYYPIWCVPYRRPRDYEWLSASFWSRFGPAPLFLDLAIYGLRQHGDRNLYRMFEQELAEVGGVKTLIAHNYYTEDEFWAIWNKPSYDAVKAITDPHNVFRDLFTKTCRTAMGLPAAPARPAAVAHGMLGLASHEAPTAHPE